MGKKKMSAAFEKVKNDEVVDNMKAAMEGVKESINQGLKKMKESMDKVGALDKLEEAKGKIDNMMTSIKDKEAYAKIVNILDNAKANIGENIIMINTKVTEAKAF